VTNSADDTIAAIATPPGEGGIGIVRMSGSEAVPIAGRLFRSAASRRLDDGTRQVYYGEMIDGGVAVDEVLVHVMRAPHSYTTEDVVEINAHGGAGPLHTILSLCLREGARLAEPGEFTRRAFLHGRIDLVQAEAVIDRIRAQSRAALQAASAAGRGALSRELDGIRRRLLDAKAHIEAAVDFPDQDLPERITPELRRAVDDAIEAMTQLLATADAGRLLREGAEVAIAGRPNVGKSSLFNALLRETRAIVTPRAGTTRDLLREVISVEGIPVRLTDMAGLRDTDDEIARLGVAAAHEALEEAALILLVMDATEGFTDADRAILDRARQSDVPVMLVRNKIDIASEVDTTRDRSSFIDIVDVSAVTGQGLVEFERCLGRHLRGDLSIAPDRANLTRVHQKESLRRALAAVKRVRGNFGMSPEFMAIDLDEALAAVGEITGETTPDDVLEQIFEAFCIGK